MDREEGHVRQRETAGTKSKRLLRLWYIPKTASMTEENGLYLEAWE